MASTPVEIKVLGFIMPPATEGRKRLANALG
jgi:hypothetical protein